MKKEQQYFAFFDENGWASDEEFKDGLTAHRWNEKVTVDGKTLHASGTPLLVEDDTVYVDANDSHTLVFGNTGSKKTRNFCVPNVYMLGLAGESMVIADPKGEIYKRTSGFLKSEGYDLQVINFRNMEYGQKWNPLALPYYFYKNGNPDLGIEMVRDFCGQLVDIVHSEKDVFWENIARDMLEGLIYLLFEIATDVSEVTIENVRKLRSSIKCMKGDEETEEGKLLYDLVCSFPEDSLVNYKLIPVFDIKNLEKTFGSVIVVFDTMISQFISQRNLLDLMRVSEINYEEISTKKTALYLIVPDEKRTLHFLVSTFVKQCYEHLIYYAQQYQEGVLKRRVNFILDEFCNFSKIKDMSSMISAARSRNIRFVLIVQSKQQLEMLYDKDAETIRSNCRNWIFLASREVSLLREIEELCGEITIEGEGARPLITETGLQRLEIGWEESQVLILRSQKRPYLTWIKDFALYPQSQYEEVPMKKSTPCMPKIFSLKKYFSDIKIKEEVGDLVTLDEFFE